MNEYTVSIMGGDLPGIVAAVTGALLGARGNVENRRAGILAGTPCAVQDEGVEARVILNEMDHLDGVLILDRVASLALDVCPRRGRGRRG